MLDHILLLPHQNIVPAGFTLKHQNIQISQYQLYAVERYILQRTQYQHLLVVYTGDQQHSIALDAFTPDSPRAWSDTLALLRSDGAKSKSTPHGILVVTSLAHFRSDYNIVKIPTGNFLSIRDQLYTNVNLLRMGCSGRTALTLEDPSEVTKDRFINSYQLPENTITPVPNPASIDHLPLPPVLGTNTQSASKHSPQLGYARPGAQVWRTPDKTPNQSTSSLPNRLPKDREKVLIARTKDPASFVPTVLEFVKLIQAALAIFGLFPDETSAVQPTIIPDGLLCDNTVKGIKKWTVQVGAPCVGLEPSDRIVDPLFVSALLSLVLAIRNKLADIGYAFILPRDPFLNPYAFATAISAYIQSTTTPSTTTLPPSFAPAHHHYTFSSPHHSVHVTAPIIPAAPPATSVLSASAAAAAALASSQSSIATVTCALPTTALGTVLTRATTDAIVAAYDAKLHAESRKVRRVLKNKLAAAVDSDTPENALAATKSLSDGEREVYNVGASGGGANVGNSVPGDPGTLTAPTLDLAAFVLFVAGPGRTGLQGIDGAARRGTVSSTGGGGKGSSGSGQGVVARTKGRARRISRDIGVGVGVPGAESRRRESLERALLAADPSVPAGTGTSAGGAGGGTYAYAYETGRERAAREGVVGASVKALFGGRVADLVRMREEAEREAEREREIHIHSVTGDGPDKWAVEGAGTTGSTDGKRWLGGLGGGDKERDKERANARRRRGLSPGGVASDGDADEARARQMDDGRSTEEESDVIAGYLPGGAFPGQGHSFGGMWTGRMRGKLGNWAGLTRRKHQSVDLSASSSMQSSARAGLATAATAIGKDKETDTESAPKGADSYQPSPQPSLLAQSFNSNSTANPNPNPNLNLNLNANSNNGSPANSTRQRPTTSRLSIGGIGRRVSERSGVSTLASRSRAQSPTLPPMVFSGDGERDLDDDDLLSSGQVSPLSDDRPNPFAIHGRRNQGNNQLGAVSPSDDVHTLTQLLLAQKRTTRPRRTQSARVASWADPISAREDGEEREEDDEEYIGEEEDQSRVPRLPFSRRGAASSDKRDISATRSVSDEDAEGEEESDVSRLGGYLAPRRGRGNARWQRGREKARFHSLLSVVDGAGVLVEEPLEDDEEEDEDGDEEACEDGDDTDVFWRRRKVIGFDPRRRRSFHDLDTFRGMEVLSKAHMELDVELCSELLIMRRREKHLCNVIACVKLLSDSLSSTNTGLREHYESHLPSLPEIEARAAVLAQLDAENTKANKIFQATNTLRYEAEQFRVADLWQTASPPRRTVFELREKVFGAGGRRLPAGVRGAHGAYNRLQWTLDGRERLVDHLGRTESEAEEEADLDGRHVFAPLAQAEAAAGEEGEEEENVVEHPGIKPMWLLRFFTSWGARWSAAASAPPVASATSAETPTTAKVADDLKAVVLEGNEIASDQSAQSTPATPVVIDKLPTRSASH